MKKINILIITNKTLCASLIRAFKLSDISGEIYALGNINIYPYFEEKKYINFLKIKNKNDLIHQIKDKNIHLIIISEAFYIQKGLANFLKYNLKVPTFSVTRFWLQLEESKLFAKKFMTKYQIPTPAYKIIKDIKDLRKCILDYGLPIVLKNDGLKAGFGSYICINEKDCLKIAKKLLKENSFFIVEKYIKGKEVTLHTIWDGNILLPLIAVRDYKRLENGNNGINTGSMGSYTPVKLSINQEKMINEYVNYLERIFQKIKPNFTGIFASDLIFTEDKLYNLEFNMRPCTPEFEVICEHIEEDMLSIIYDTALSILSKREIKYKKGITGAVNIVHKDYSKFLCCRKKINIPDNFFINNKNIRINSNVFPTNKKSEFIVYPCYKLFSLIKNHLSNPFPYIYNHIQKISDKNIYYRNDIGDEL